MFGSIKIIAVIYNRDHDSYLVADISYLAGIKHSQFIPCDTLDIFVGLQIDEYIEQIGRAHV